MEKKDLIELGSRYSGEFCDVRQELQSAIETYIAEHGPIENLETSTTVYADGYIVIDVKSVRINDCGALIVEDAEGYEYCSSDWTHDTLLDICCCI